MVFAIAWTLALGKDVHWDAINYHFYLGFSALNDRFAQDFFAAGTPSYLAPYAYVPLYLMSAAGWSALAVAVAIAAWHSLAIWLSFEIAMAAGVRAPGTRLTAFALLGAMFAAANPVLLQGLGSTMTDLSTGVFALAGWLGVARSLREGGTRTLVVAGVLSGVAAALKLSNAVFAIAALVALVFLPGRPRERVRGITVFAVVCGVSFAALSLPWAMQLWREFGNPLFPFFNHIFMSPDFTSEPLRYERFMPSGPAAFMLRPFEMLSASSHVHTEPRAPDVRYAALVGLAALFAFARCRVSGIPQQGPGFGDPEDAAAGRTLSGLILGVTVAWVIWLAISGNSRYFLPMACVTGVVVALLLQRLHFRWPDATLVLLVVLCGMQTVQLGIGADLRRDGGAWTGPWMRVEVPDRLREQPALYLSAGFLSASAILPFMHPQSGMINVGGFNVISPGHPGFERAKVHMDRNADRLRLLLPLPPGVVDRATLPGPPGQLDVYVRRLGLRVDGDDCEFLRIQGNLRGERRPDATSSWKHFISCRLVRAPEERQAYERRVSAVDAAFDRVEDTCPNLFHPRRPPTQEFGYLSRTYHMGSEMQLFVDEGRVKYFFPLRGGDPIDIGSLADWQQAPQAFDCTRRTQPAFAAVGR